MKLHQPYIDPYMSYSLNSLRGVRKGDFLGEYYGGDILGVLIMAHMVYPHHTMYVRFRLFA